VTAAGAGGRENISNVFSRAVILAPISCSAWLGAGAAAIDSCCGTAGFLDHALPRSALCRYLYIDCCPKWTMSRGAVNIRYEKDMGRTSYHHTRFGGLHRQ
jgi:hypothetical protein